ncbi:MAG: DNA repair protein RecN [Paracidovorax wautersii]|uniref:DNA repair protein RecN n=1 Tax=Paracidovorax wautersii TaxID=1177982 RepID=A0A7V8FL17_9BURK|nr:MAG: DNA repair protein RecN [Paracidovorax wautersii]
MAIKRLALKDFVIVDALEIELAGGFTALTGETGAGKSILIDALQLVLGSRADADVVREGCARAEIAAEFERSAPVDAWLQAAGYEAEDTLLLRRVIDGGQGEAAGKSRAWINGSPATATQLRELGGLLVDIHGQHAWQSLTRPDAVRGLLDAYAQVDTQALQTTWQTWRQAAQALHEAEQAQATLRTEHERLTWQIGELDKLAPADGQWEELQTEHTRLSNVQGLMDAAQGTLQALEGDDGEVPGALRLLAQAQDALAAEQDAEPQFRALADILAQSLAQAEDAVHSLHTYLRKSGPDPERLAELDERIAQWLSLARRYRHTPEALPALLAEWRAELQRLDAAADLDSLHQTEQKAQQAYLREARAVSRQRQTAAPRLGTAITQAMQGLGMQGGRFEVALHESQPTAHGLESIEFLAAGHAGSTPRPVGKVASGGELSRMALAIAVTTSQLGTAQTLIFDEVDSGVGGAVAETVGRLMRQLGRDRQVMAVTHLPQVAACADHHLVVHKKLRGKQTLSSIEAVRDEHRVSEIGRMLGGEKLSGATLAHAREMLETSLG